MIWHSIIAVIERSWFTNHEPTSISYIQIHVYDKRVVENKLLNVYLTQQGGKYMYAIHKWVD